MENRAELADALERLARHVRDGLDTLDIADRLRGLAYDAENIYD